jgi:hypothetical protein
MRERSRFIIFIAIASLLAGLVAFPAAADAGAENVVYFTAVNNRLLELKAETMPVKIKSQIYVPCSVFNVSELGTRAQYFPDSQLAIVANETTKLYFDLSAGITYDNNGKYYKFAAAYVNNTAYLPVYYVVKEVFTDIAYTYNRYEEFHLVRLTRGDALSVEDFIGGAAMLIKIQLGQYNKSVATTEPTSAPVETAAPSPTSTYAPGPKPSDGGKAAEPDRSAVTVYLAFLGLGERTGELLDRLDKHGLKACFFASAEQLKAYPDLARRICGTGHTLGILLGENPELDYSEASEVLLSAARTAVFLTAADRELSDAELEKLAAEGLILWSAQPAEGYSSYIYARLEKAKKRCDIILNGEEPPGGASIEKLLGTLEQYNYTVGRINELAETKLEQ